MKFAGRRAAPDAAPERRERLQKIKYELATPEGKLELERKLKVATEIGNLEPATTSTGRSSTTAGE